MTDINSAASLTKMGLLFLEGLLSFLSPCVIPILPIYIGILAGKKEENANGELVFNKKNTITNTLFFVLGICATFFILAFATSFISVFLNENIKTLQTNHLSGDIFFLLFLLNLQQVNLKKMNSWFNQLLILIQKLKVLTYFLAARTWEYSKPLVSLKM